ncbi:MAG: DUF2169 domain-containing protein [Myxococcota bacterium]
MQITSNTTGMEAGLAVITDKDAHDYCVVVVKGTFVTDDRGELRLAKPPIPLVYADEHYGDPESTSIKYETDFSLRKPQTDVVVVGKAVAPEGRPVNRMMVRLEVEGRTKDIAVFGERRWVRAAGGLRFSPPVPFREMPLTFDRAFGGIDNSTNSNTVAAERRNLVGVGFARNRSPRAMDGRPLPNLERPDQLIRSPGNWPTPIGLGFVGRSWLPRAGFTGTYDQRWRDEIAPFLPADFDDRYFQAAPVDQHFPPFEGGERIRCVHMAHQPVVEYRLPRIELPIRFRFRGGDRIQHPMLDTVVVEPHESRALLTWRTSVVLGKKLNELIEIGIGPAPASPGPVGRRRGKPLFENLDTLVRWRRQKQH